MSPQMKSILLSFKHLHLNPNASSDVEDLDEGEKTPGLSRSEESQQKLPLVHGKFCFSPIHENGNRSLKFDKLYSTMVQAQGLVIDQTKEAVRPERRSWAFSKRRVLMRSNTVDSLPVQKSNSEIYSSIRCKESLGGQCSTEGQTNSAPQSPVLERKANVMFEKRIKPKSALVVSSVSQVAPVCGEEQPTNGARRVGIKVSSAVLTRGTTGIQKTQSAWERLSEERTFLINKWLARQDC